MTATSSKVISERALDAARPLKVIYIGAGVSGILAAIRFRQAVPDLEFVIYEKNPEVGGTWYENRYPGCACDVPSHLYQLTFESWPEWSKFYAGSQEILEYWKMVAKKYNVYNYVRFNSRCIEARWREDTSTWKVRIQNLEQHTITEDCADVLMTGTGTLNEWKWPEISGLHDFAGPLMHSANWDAEVDLKNKSVAVVGAGSSGIQIVPAIATHVKSMDHYIRGRTWIASQIAEDVVKARSEDGKMTTNFDYSTEEKKTWRQNPEAYLEYRKALEFGLQNNYAITQRGSKAQAIAVKRYEESMRERLKDKPEILSNLLPNFPPLCKRLTPGPGYLEALSSSKVNVITSQISYIDATGIMTNDGVHHPVDVIICATGFHTTASAGFPIYGRDGANLRDKFRLRPRTYLGLCTDNFPNFFQSLGPNSFQGSGSLLAAIEYVHLYVAQILQHMATSNIKTVEPKRKQVDNFTTFCEEYFKRTVYTAECSSWYKSSIEEEKVSGRVNALWPGSCLHALSVLKHVRWQDYEIEHVDGNEFGWFGNGWTVAEKGTAPGLDDLTWYLTETNLLGGRDANIAQHSACNGENGDVSHEQKSADDVVVEALGLHEDIQIKAWTQTV